METGTEQDNMSSFLKEAKKTAGEIVAKASKINDPYQRTLNIVSNEQDLIAILTPVCLFLKKAQEAQKKKNPNDASRYYWRAALLLLEKADKKHNDACLDTYKIFMLGDYKIFLSLVTREQYDEFITNIAICALRRWNSEKKKQYTGNAQEMPAYALNHLPNIIREYVTGKISVDAEYILHGGNLDKIIDSMFTDTDSRTPNAKLLYFRFLCATLESHVLLAEDSELSEVLQEHFERFKDETLNFAEGIIELSLEKEVYKGLKISEKEVMTALLVRHELLHVLHEDNKAFR